MDKAASRKEIALLVEQYQERIKQRDYNEAQIRKDFIDRLFSALGWDIHNNVIEDEVTTEENVSGKRVDLAFRLNHIPVMFLEAKRPEKADFEAKVQVINYCWNKGVTWAVLTDFLSIQVLNADFGPSHLDQADLFGKLEFSDYLTRFDQLWLLSKESFEKGLIYEEAKKWNKLPPKIKVDEKLFADLTNWRKILSSGFKKHNSISEEDLDEGVQRILDRFIFIRTAEDRGLNDKVLWPLFQNYEHAKSKTILFNDIFNKFRTFDDWYNSELFLKHACEDWCIDDKDIFKVIAGLYETEGHYSYDFKAISVDILGGIYEQYLGYVQGKYQRDVRDSKIHRKRKQGGIYFTPPYVVNFIINETLGKLINETKLKDIPNIKVLDPACGSGSFLISAYNKILGKIERESKQTSFFDKFNILKENIYGVDIDEQAIQIAQLNLLLQVLTQKERLPKLGHNIRVGNSLLHFGLNKLKPFDWQSNFKEVFKQGGFDVIVGNPPYIKQFTNNTAFEGLRNSPYFQGKMDIWTLFACRAIDLLRDGGYFGFIAPNNWIKNFGASIFRNKILSEGEIIRYIDFGDFKVFPDAGIQTMIFVFQKKKLRQFHAVSYAKVVDKKIEKEAVARFLGSGMTYKEPKINKYIAEIRLGKKNEITFSNKSINNILKKIEGKRTFCLLKKELAQGIIGGPDKAFIFPENVKYTSHENKVLKVFYTSSNRYSHGERRGLIAYLSKNIDDLRFMPNIEKNIEKYIKELKSRREVKSRQIKYFHLHWPRDEKYFKKGPKIVSCIRTAAPGCFYTENEYYGSRAMNFIITERINMKYLTGILNSCLSFFWLKKMGKQLGDLLQVDTGPLMGIPIYQAGVDDQRKIASLVERITALTEELEGIKENTDKWRLTKQEIERIERKIDDEVYIIYGITDDERKIIEDNLANA